MPGTGPLTVATSNSPDTTPPPGPSPEDPVSLSDALRAESIEYLTVEDMERFKIAPILVIAKSSTDYIDKGVYLCSVDEDESPHVLRLIKDGEVDEDSSITPDDPCGFPLMQIILSRNTIRLFSQNNEDRLITDLRPSEEEVQIFSATRIPLSIIFFQDSDRFLNQLKNLEKPDTPKNRSTVETPIEAA